MNTVEAALPAPTEDQKREREKKEKEKKKDAEKGWHDAILAVTVLLTPALVGLILFAIPATREGIGIAVLTAAASFGVGSLFGFIFGIPRILSSQAEGAEIVEDGRRRVAPNTNLEQISDWLTKILVGVGLVELGEISGGIDSLAEGLAPSLGGGNTGYPVAVTILIAFTIIGFIGSYLFTRLRLEGAFSLENFLRDKVEPIAEQVQQVKKDIDESSVAAARGMALVENQLDLRKTGVAQDELNEALRDATRAARVNAFYLAREQRRANWRDGDRDLVERTIPVFKALIACDEQDQFHRNHGELAYALKDQDVPDYPGALAELSHAIGIRPPGSELRYWPYEFNRAWLSVELDPAFKAGGASPEDLVQAVAGDLELVVQSKTGRGAIKGDRRLKEWIALNDADPRVAALKAKLEL